ncbi:MAG TPA: PQQ-dependent sugar dehydrogenase, partial [Acidimicrobiales bacterium]
ALDGDGGIDERSRRAVFALDQPFPNHNGGHLAFGPDGLLYIGLGDGGAAGDPLEAGQDRGQLLGSILRIDPNGVDGSAYAIPNDNPFVDEEGARPEVWLKGVRNPWRFSFDRATGDLWVGDVGQNEIEEIDLLPADADGLNAGRGLNLGWNAMEGDQPYEDGVEPDDHTPPVFTYTHAEGGCSVTGGYLYRGAAIPALVGAYLYADYCAGDLRALAVPDGEVIDDATIAEPVDSPVSFAEDPTGELYLLSLTGPLLKIVPQ